MVALQTDMSIPKDVDSIQIQVSVYGNTLFENRYDVGPSALLIPATLALVAGEESPPVRIQVSARQKGKLRTLREAITTIPRDRIATLRMPIQWLCDGHARDTDSGNPESTCPEGQTCVAGRCESANVDSASLKTYDSRDIFGGGSGKGDGTCFDTVSCFSDGVGVDVRLHADGRCGFEKPLGAENINVALVLKKGSDGICGPEACLIPLDAAADSGWYEQDGLIMVPRAVCDRLEQDPEKTPVVAVALTTSCETKTESIPTCGPWSSVTTNPGQFDAGPPDVAKLVDADPQPDGDAEPEADVDASPEAEADVTLDVPSDVEAEPSDLCPGTAFVLNQQDQGSFAGTTAALSQTNASTYVSSACAAQGTADGKQYILRMTPGKSGMMSCYLHSQVTTWSSVLYVRSSCDDASSELACNDAYDEQQQGVTFPVQASETYYLFVDGNGEGEEGAFDLHCDLTPVECTELERVGPEGYCVAKLVTMPGGWSIDATQVTYRQYMSWLAHQPSMADQPPICQENDSYEPVYPVLDDYPVTHVDWCDAYAYCKGVGKRLCGRIGGGQNPWNALKDESSSQWYAACSSGGKNVYPYGNDYEATACFGRDIGEEELAPVGSYLGCQSSETGYEGVFDLSGNVWEWEDCCKTENESSLCRVRGGALNSEQDELRCDYDLAFNPFDTSPSIGFRCCFP